MRSGTWLAYFAGWSRFLLILAALGGVGYFGYFQAASYIKERGRPVWKFEPVTQGDIVYEINATGTVKPVRSVTVGSFVSGPVNAIFADFNDVVKEGDLLATVDPRLFDANVARDRATLETRKAEVIRVQAQLDQAINDERRSRELRKENRDFISDAEMDQFKYARKALEAQLAVANAAVEQADANLENSNTNLVYTKILSPVSGIIIDRKIDPGQTLASAFQAPELFIVAPDMEEKMHIFASVDEADIGLIRVAKELNQKVRFQVNAYPETPFEGEIEQVRFSSEENQNVVTYPVIVAAANPGMKLLPGMTANLSFQIDEKNGVLRIPNAALRYLPEARLVREVDKPLLEGVAIVEEDSQVEAQSQSVRDQVAAAANRSKRHVWVVNESDPEKSRLRAVAVEVGISDYKYTELVAGELNVDDQLVIGMTTKAQAQANQ